MGNILIDILANDRKRKLQLYLMVSKEIGEEIKRTMIHKGPLKDVGT